MNVKRSRKMIDVFIDLQIACEHCEHLPSEAYFHQWVFATLAQVDWSEKEAEITIRIVDNDEIQSLNLSFRGKDRPTNVLSFPFDAEGLPEEVISENVLIGDVIIANDVILKEAEEQKKPLLAHWAHITIHGVLHLLGYDHIEEEEAEEMESLESKVLQNFDIKDPYLY